MFVPIDCLYLWGSGPLLNVCMEVDAVRDIVGGAKANFLGPMTVL